MKLKKGDTVEVITGKDKGKEGEIVHASSRPTTRSSSTASTPAAKHQRPRKANQQAGIIDKDMPINAINVMFVHKGKTVRLGYTVDKKGNKVRVARPKGEEV